MNDSGSALHDLDSNLRGSLLLPGEPAYAVRSKLASARNQRHPLAIAQCTGVADVVNTIQFARGQGIDFTVLAGGHELDGWGLQDGVLALDLTPMNGVLVDPRGRRGVVQAGSRLGIMDRETAVHGLAVTGGTVSDTGVAGLTLGGGIGWLVRRHGATLDNVTAIDAVTVEGDLVRASAEDNPDLFWAMRGGGGNFAVATSFELDLHPMSPTILAGSVIHSAADAPAFLRHYREFMLDAPDDVGGMAILLRANGPDVPADRHGELICVTILVYTGDLHEGERVLAPLRSAITPLSDTVRPQLYTTLQQVFEGPLLSQEDRRTYQKSGFLPEMSDAYLDEAMDLMKASPVPRAGERDGTLITISAMGGAFLRVGEESTAMPRGGANFYWEAIASHARVEEDEIWTGYVRDQMAPRLRAHSGPRAYLNHNSLDDDAAEFIPWAYGADKFARLQKIKSQWDPHNLLRYNKNIPPEGQARPLPEASGQTWSS
ncbi:MAG: hypothetical protein AVDCRST_MAG52-2950 [uncultured Blastococcus sp.]|uniref:FAD-binding PCMH-type domain-containing protein n=1 Tax=uncultured Blastococcus sp. TaxID=217144 RepID=A0A6J4J0D1_9ACTN|nr:MAG: hypothetical protein AVDCRST_MAG52-2950 [uncultured Blastococcus sp.]